MISDDFQTSYSTNKPTDGCTVLNNFLENNISIQTSFPIHLGGSNKKEARHETFPFRLKKGEYNILILYLFFLSLSLFCNTSATKMSWHTPVTISILQTFSNIFQEKSFNFRYLKIRYKNSYLNIYIVDFS